MAGINLLWRSSETSIRRSAANAVHLAETHGYRTLAFPVIGAGSGGFPPEKALNILLDELRTLTSPVVARVVIYAPAP